MKTLAKTLSLSIVAALISGCSSVTDVVPDEKVLNVNGNTYEILDVDYRGIFGSENSLKSSVIAQADKFLEMFYIYFQGEERKQNYSLAKMPVYKSIKALEKCILANAPLCPRMGSVGSTYLGDGDVDNAVKWFNITAKSGHGDSAFMLALLNIDGKFLPKNPTQAKKYYKQAFDIHMKNRDLAAAKEVNDHYKESLNDNRGLNY